MGLLRGRGGPGFGVQRRSAGSRCPAAVSPQCPDPIAAKTGRRTGTERDSRFSHAEECGPMERISPYTRLPRLTLDTTMRRQHSTRHTTTPVRVEMMKKERQTWQIDGLLAPERTVTGTPRNCARLVPSGRLDQRTTRYMTSRAVTTATKFGRKETGPGSMWSTGPTANTCGPTPASPRRTTSTTCRTADGPLHRHPRPVTSRAYVRCAAQAHAQIRPRTVTESTNCPVRLCANDPSTGQC